MSIKLSIVLVMGFVAALAEGSPLTTNQQAGVCMRELENANRTLSNWAENMESMVNESKLPATIRESIHNEANRVLDMIEEFGEQYKNKPALQLSKDLVNIRRASNKMALDIYLNTFDMRWPQNSLQVGITVERVQQACLDRSTIQLLESPESPLELIKKNEIEA